MSSDTGRIAKGSTSAAFAIDGCATDKGSRLRPRVTEPTLESSAASPPAFYGTLQAVGVCIWRGGPFRKWTGKVLRMRDSKCSLLAIGLPGDSQGDPAGRPRKAPCALTNNFHKQRCFQALVFVNCGKNPSIGYSRPWTGFFGRPRSDMLHTSVEEESPMLARRLCRPNCDCRSPAPRHAQIAVSGPDRKRFRPGPRGRLSSFPNHLWRLIPFAFIDHPSQVHATGHPPSFDSVYDENPNSNPEPATVSPDRVRRTDNRSASLCGG